MSHQNKINFIQRSPHDKKNPFVMINKEMLRDPDLNPRAKGILCYLLSFHDQWKADPDVISKDQNISRDVTYAILNEIIEAGYAYREVQREAGKFKSWNFYFSEFKVSTHGEKPVCENPEMAYNQCEPFPEKPELAKPELDLEEVAHISNNNDSINIEQQQPLTPSKEKEVVQEVVVQSKDQEEILRMLVPYEPSQEIKDIAMKMSTEKVQLAIEALEQGIESKTVGYPLGFLRRALEKGWTPNENLRKIKPKQQLVEIPKHEIDLEAEAARKEEHKEYAERLVLEFHDKKDQYPGKKVFTTVDSIFFSDYTKCKEIKIEFKEPFFDWKIRDAIKEFKEW
jgi:hypothetical protein